LYDGTVGPQNGHNGLRDLNHAEAGRNKRSVWNVATQPYAGAHFATFPLKLIEPCVLAGCPEGGTVLDPFAGAGTTGVVALQHGRSFVGAELNPLYARLARDRIATAVRLGFRSPVVVPAVVDQGSLFG
jgi:DNA modification methylase